MMTSENQRIFSVLDKLGGCPDSEKKTLVDKMHISTLQRDEFFLMQGDAPDRVAFILSGIFRVFCNTESGDEKTLAFRTPDQFLAAYSPFLTNRDSWYSIQALTEGTLYSISFKHYSTLLTAHPCWDRIIKNYMIQLFMEKEDRERSFLLEDAKTRYIQFTKSYPELWEQIPQFHIASYLGISPVSLSRIRRELKQT